MIVEKPFVTSSKQLNYIRKKLRTKKLIVIALTISAIDQFHKNKKNNTNKKLGKFSLNIIYRRFRKFQT